MDFRVTDDQEALRAGIRSFCDGRVPFEALVELADKPVEDSGDSPAKALWNDLAELGVLSLRIREEDGGLGLGLTEAALVFAELGRRLVPGPLLWSALIAELLPGVVDGGLIVTGLDRVRSTSDPLLIEHFGLSDTLVVFEAEGVRKIDTKALRAKLVETPFDPLTPLHQVEALHEGELLADAETCQRLWEEGALLASAMQLGIAEATLDYATAYSLEREQFDRPIGSFQAIKHMLADMLVRKEQALAAVYAAATTADGRGVDDPKRMISTAKLIAGEAAHKNARNCIQIYGGMGYVWEMPPHFYLKRAFVLENVFGTMDEHADRVADILGAHAAQKAAS